MPDLAADVAMPQPDAAGRAPRRGAASAPTRHLFDIKVVYGATQSYVTGATADTQCGVVAARARAVHGEYESHARRIDQGAHVAAGTTPCTQRLQSFPRVRGLVFGQYGEYSDDVETLLVAAADGAAQRTWRHLGARTQAEARSYYMARFRRRIGLTAVIELARHRLRRVPYVGVTRAQVRAVREGIGAGLHARDAETRRAIRPEDFYRYVLQKPIDYGALLFKYDTS